MLGNIMDALRGTTTKQNPAAAPYDRIVFDRMVSHPQAFIPAVINPKLRLHSSRTAPRDIEQIQQTTPVDINPDHPNIFNKNGIARLPNAGRFRR